ncbi:MAG: hypothetical protein MR698_08195 [Selenomonas sp.]|nr:hypothetical protein [Selenomonas sp.]
MQMNSKRFACGLFLLAFLVAALEIAFWHGVTKETFYEHDGHGDLARMGALVIPRAETPNADWQPQHETLQHYIAEGSEEQYDVLVVGDSMMGGGGGASCLDDLAARYGVRSIFATRLLRGQDDSIDVYQMARLLVQLGYVDRIRPRYLVLECGERMIGVHFASRVLPPQDWSKKEFERTYLAYREVRGRGIVPPGTLLSTTMAAANKAYVLNHLYAKEHDGQPSPDVARAELTIPAFSNPGWERTLLSFAEDGRYLAEPPDAAAVNDELNAFAAVLAQHGVQLVVLVPPDKSDVYQPWLAESSRLPENPFYDEIRPLRKDYIFIEAKAPLRAAVAAGIQDLYWCDDTHWSWRAQQMVNDVLGPALAIPASSDADGEVQP